MNDKDDILEPDNDLDYYSNQSTSNFDTTICWSKF